MTNLLLGIDIGGRRIKAGLVDSNGLLCRQLAVPTPADIEQFRYALESIITEIAGTARIGAVGVACKGIIDPETTKVEVVPGIFRFLEGVTLSQVVGAAVKEKVPVFADNDARVALMGERVWGAARGLRNVVMLTLGSGLGGAALVEGRLLHGKNSVGGHLGHVTINPRGPMCVCGNKGCLEAYFSGNAIEAEARAALCRGCESPMTAAFSNRPEDLTCEEIFRWAARQDPVAAAIVNRAIEYLAAGIAGLVHIFDPEMVILGGQISLNDTVLLPTIRAEVGWRTQRLIRRPVPIVRQQLSDPSGVIGAAALAHLCCQGRAEAKSLSARDRAFSGLIEN